MIVVGAHHGLFSERGLRRLKSHHRPDLNLPLQRELVHTPALRQVQRVAHIDKEGPRGAQAIVLRRGHQAILHQNRKVRRAIERECDPQSLMHIAKSTARILHVWFEKKNRVTISLMARLHFVLQAVDEPEKVMLVQLAVNALNELLPQRLPPPQVARIEERGGLCQVIAERVDAIANGMNAVAKVQLQIPQGIKHGTNEIFLTRSWIALRNKTKVDIRMITQLVAAEPTDRDQRDRPAHVLRVEPTGHFLQVMDEDALDVRRVETCSLQTFHRAMPFARAFARRVKHPAQ